MASKMGEPMTRTDLLSLGSVTTVEQAGNALGYSRQHSYNLIYRGEFPVPVHKVGRLYRVPTAPLLRYLGVDPNESARRPSTPASTSSEEPLTSSVVKTKSGRVIRPDKSYRVRGRLWDGADLIEAARIFGIAS